ncbi:MAG: cytochrome P460 family protein [Chloroflexota bacterium]
MDKYRYTALVIAFCTLTAGLLLLRAPETTADVARLNTNIEGLANYREDFVQYATITRPDNLSRDLYISPDVAEVIANNSTARLPEGTTIVIEAHRVRAGIGGAHERTGIADNVHVAVKNSNWGPEDYQTNERAGDWNYFSFDPETGVISDESTFECFDCHANNSQIDFLFSRRQLVAFGETNTIQDEFCNLPNRIPCR